MNDDIKSKKKSILFLGYDKNETTLIKELENRNCKVNHTSKNIKSLSGYHLVISFGYKYLIPKETINSCNCDIINLHISYLPWNRGAHPNFWSFYDDTISGVTIHLINEGIDKGNIIYQKKISFNTKNHTFSDTYNILIKEIEFLFLSRIDNILNKTYKTFPQSGKGSFHKKKDLPVKFTGWQSNIYEEIKNLKTNS